MLTSARLVVTKTKPQVRFYHHEAVAKTFKTLDFSIIRKIGKGYQKLNIYQKGVVLTFGIFATGNVTTKTKTLSLNKTHYEADKMNIRFFTEDTFFCHGVILDEKYVLLYVMAICCHRVSVFTKNRPPVPVIGI